MQGFRADSSLELGVVACGFANRGVLICETAKGLRVLLSQNPAHEKARDGERGLFLHNLVAAFFYSVFACVVLLARLGGTICAATCPPTFA